ncbi:MAG: amidohydrolase family protein [Rhodopila sp.]|nr:amidohydrolase family protein [Rhodopila sp.]
MPSTPLGPRVDTHPHIYLTGQPPVGNDKHRPERAFTTDDDLQTLDDDRVLFGSDWPFIGPKDPIAYRNTIDWFRGFLPSPAAQEEIGRTAARLYRFA